MLTWRDAEEAAELVQRRADWEVVLRPEHISALEEFELEAEQVSLRRRLASAFVQIGVRLDPSIAEELKEQAVA
jgi:hypothetical protein